MNKKHSNIFNRIYHGSALERFLVFYSHPIPIIRRLYTQSINNNVIYIYAE